MKQWTLLIFCMLFAMSSLLVAQDELVVVPFTGQTDYVSLTDVIHGDTLADGSRANPNRIYKLEKGGFYLLNGRIEAYDYDLRLIGEPGDETTPPPTVVHDVNAEGGHAYDMIIVGQNATVKDILFNASDINSSPSRRFIDVTSNDSKVVIDNCIFENFLQRLVDLRGTVGTSIFFANNLAMNIIDTNNEWGAHIFHTANTDGDTMWVQNNTFYNFGHNATAPGTKFNFSWWNHNTFVNFGHRILGHDYNKEHYFTENLIYNASIVGEAVEWFPANGGTWEAVFGLVDSDTLPGGPDPERVVWYDANNFEEGAAYDVLYDNNSGNTRRLMVPVKGERLQWMLDDDATWPKVDEGSWYAEHPNFTDEAKVAANLDQQVAWTQEAWMDSVPPVRTDRVWDMDGDGDPLTTPWPIPLDLSFTNELLLTEGHDGLPLGDLRWFPNKKAIWEDSKEAIEQKIKSMEVATAVEDAAMIPTGMNLGQNYPNPFNPTTNINYTLQKKGQVRIALFNMMGQEVKTLVDQAMPAGTHFVQWDGTDDAHNKVSAGVYFYKMTVGEKQQIRKMILMK